MLGTSWVRLGHGFGSGRGGRHVIGAGDVSGPGRVLGPGVLGRVVLVLGHAGRGGVGNRVR